MEIFSKECEYNFRGNYEEMNICELKVIFKKNNVSKETEQIIADYEELFNEGLDQGLTEEEVVLN